MGVSDRAERTFLAFCAQRYGKDFVPPVRFDADHVTFVTSGATLTVHNSVEARDLLAFADGFLSVLSKREREARYQRAASVLGVPWEEVSGFMEGRG
jgi:hypothetical protein